MDKQAEDLVVVSGIAGQFPNAKNTLELANNLYNKIDMVDDDEKRWRHTNDAIPKRMGKISSVEKFDATFFGVHFKQAHTMDPQCRLLIEHAYEAIVDSGINPKTLRGTKTGVFIGACFVEAEKTWFYEKISSSGFGLTGCSRAMLANRVSYSLGLTGPSCLIDTACSSSMHALDTALRSIRNGNCDAALVGGSNLLLLPDVSLQFAKLGVLAPDGVGRPFDINASGYARSEAVCVMFLQKSKDAKRIYGSVIYSKTNCNGYKEEGITYPSGVAQAKLFNEFYQDIGINPATVAYIEAHSTGSAIGDSEECKALDKVFCTGRNKPLPVGSVKSNIGHTEPAAGCCSIAKVLLAFHYGLIPPNINFHEYRNDIPAFVEGRLKVITEATPLDGKLVGVNSFGFCGTNAHCLLRADGKKKVNFGLPTDFLPRVITWSGRTEEAVNMMLDDIAQRPIDVEHVALLHNIQQETTPGHVFRGFGLYEQSKGENAVCLSREVQHFTGLKRPLVFIFSGMGSQWCEMGTSLMNVPMFRKSVQMSHAVLEKRGLNLINILTSSDKTMYDNILHSFVGIAAIQIALVDVLKMLGIEPDFIVGHSVGELGCAYADGCFTAEQMILAAYSRGMATAESTVIHGSMAAVGMGYSKIRTIIPSEIDVACHNGPDSCTISGPTEKVTSFVLHMKRRGIFAKEVPCSNIPYHSKYISALGPKLLARLKEVVPHPKERSPKWLSSSVPKVRWNQLDSQLCSAEYHTNNLLNSVLFEEATSLLPNNSLTIEVAPHKLLQAIMKQSMPNGVHIGLTQRGLKDNAQFLLNALGQLYMNGLDFPISSMYPLVEFPVSCGTSMISPLIRWDHSEDWFVTKFDAQTGNPRNARKVIISLSDKKFEYLSGHIIDGRVTLPAAIYLQLIWETLGLMKETNYLNIEVQFDDVMFLKAVVLPKDSAVKLVIMIQPGTGRFEITKGTIPIAIGYVKVIKEAILNDVPIAEETESSTLTTTDFYRELQFRGYHYIDQFRSVVEAGGDGLAGVVKWDCNWVSFLDSLIQISIIADYKRSLLLPTAIQNLVISPKAHAKSVHEMNPENSVLSVEASQYLNTFRCGGVEMRGLVTSLAVRRKSKSQHVLQFQNFVAHLPTPFLIKTDALRVLAQLALENFTVQKVKAIEMDFKGRQPIIPMLYDALKEFPQTTADMMFLSSQTFTHHNIHVEDGKLATQTQCTFIIAGECLGNADFTLASMSNLSEGAFIISREKLGLTGRNLNVPDGFQLLVAIPTEDETLVLLQQQRGITTTDGNPKIIETTNEDNSWLVEVRDAMKRGPVIVLAKNEKFSGIVGMVNYLRKESNSHMVSVVFIDDKTAPSFELDHPLYTNHLKLGLAINVFKDGRWGSYRYLQLNQHLKLEKRNDHCYIKALTHGDISSLTWLQGPFNSDRPMGELIRVHYAALNFRDIMLASGTLPVDVFASNHLDHDHSFGLEYAGISERGRRVMGMVISGALATHVEADETLIWDCPTHWSLQQAATVPIVYGTVYTAFFMVGRITKGKSMLIHAGSDGVGLAAIRVAFAYGLDVYTTVSTQAKRQFLLSSFNGLKVENIGSSKDTSFEKMIMLRTKGKGVDFVLNSLATDDNLQASIRCLCKGGRFLEIGKFDMTNNTSMGLGQFLKGISFHAVLLDNIFRAAPAEKEALRLIIDKDIKSGLIKPLSTTMFSGNDIEKAFRYLASSKNMGKVLCQMRDNDKDEFTTPITVIPKVYFSSQLSYVICGACDEFGLELADWLVIRGCRKLMFTSNIGISKQYWAYRTKIWKSHGVDVLISIANTTTKNGCEALLVETGEMGHIGGIFICSANLKDFIVLNNQKDGVETKFLDEAARKFCPILQHFIVFSSIVQSNNSISKSTTERIVEQRHSDGLPAKEVHWEGAEISELLHELDSLLTFHEPIVRDLVVVKPTNRGREGNVFDSIMNVLSFPGEKPLEMNKTLSELGVNSIMTCEIKHTLERELERHFTIKNLNSLTLIELQELVSTKRNKSSQDKQLKLASKNTSVTVTMLLKDMIDDGEMGEQTLLVRLNNANNHEQYSSCVLLTPGLEGVAGCAWNKIASSLSMPTFFLQLPFASDDPSGIAAEIFKQTEFFYLVGYSFGAIKTLELARSLEETGMKGHVMLIDGAPKFLKMLAINLIGEDYTNERIQLSLIAEIISLVIPEDNPEIMKTVSACRTWPARLDKIVELAKENSSLSDSYIRQLTNNVFNQIKGVLDIDLLINVVPIKSPITLIRPTEVSVVDIDEDYGLNKCTEGQINLKFIEGNHMTMLGNQELSEVINEMDPFAESIRGFERSLKHMTILD